jgi:hypothetical protein
MCYLSVWVRTSLHQICSEPFDNQSTTEFQGRPALVPCEARTSRLREGTLRATGPKDLGQETRRRLT